MFPAIKKYSYDAFSLGSVAIYSAVQLSAIVFSPLYAAPVVVYSALKTAFHAANFFHFKKYPENYAPQSLFDNYKSKTYKFMKTDLKELEAILKAYEHEKSRDLYWTYTCKAAKGLIPVYGYYLLLKGKTTPTPIAPKDTWSDINALKYHIRHLKLAP